MPATRTGASWGCDAINWSRLSDTVEESNKAKQAFEDYWALGPGRSLARLVAVYQKRTKPAPPTRQLTTLKQWSTQFNWQERIATRQQEVAVAAMEKIKAQAAETGYAVWQKRLHDLDKLAELLLAEINDPDKRWLPDVKQIGSGEDAERVDLVRFNSPLIEQFRAILGDIAAEMGERVKKVNVGGDKDNPLTITDVEATRARRWTQAGPQLAEALDDE